ncbi:MAG: hypothetical protein ABI358_01440 [Ginsengibacter sp.]
MERKFFMNDFEESLKDHADQFKMIPSKKVWHGIYNDLHPGRRWPSVTISLLLIFILIGVGYLNTHNAAQPVSAISKNTIASNNLLVNQRAKVEDKAKGNVLLKEKVIEKNNPTQNEVSSNNISSGKKDLGSKPQNIVPEQLLANNSNDIHNKQNSNYTNSTDNIDANNNSITNNAGNANKLNNGYVTSTPNNAIASTSIYDFKASLISKTSTTTDEDQKQIETEDISNTSVEQLTKRETVFINTPNFESRTKIASQIEPTQKVNKSLDENVNNADKTQFDEKITGEADVAKKTAKVNKKISKLHKKRNEKVNWVYYAAPVMSSVSFSGQAIKEAPNNNFSIALAANQTQNKVLHNPALGFEAGAQMEYSITKKLQFTTGIQLTYSGYKIISNEVHPTFATLILRDPKNGVDFPMSYISHYGDGTGQTAVSLRNYNWQASIPIGLQYQLGGNDKIKFTAGANMEPSYVFKSEAYVLSSNGRNYVNDPSLLRKWNMSSNFNAFITFKSHNFKWNIGPNVRYQWFSTYQKTYTIKEHLIDYGIRIGISK